MEATLITGASSGIGLELARIFASRKNNLVLTARSKDKLDALKTELAEKYGVSVKTIPKDLSEPGISQEIYDQLKAEDIQVECLVNNAGFGAFGLFHETGWRNEEKMIQLNVTALTHLTKLFLSLMVSRKSGRILNVASTAAFQPGPLMAVYYASKAYVLSFSEAIANELRGTGVTVTALCPGPTKSGFQKAASIEESRLVKGKKLPSSREVAEYGYRAMMRGKTVAIHGTGNRLLAFSVRFSPRRMVTAVVRKIQEKVN